MPQNPYDAFALDDEQERIQPTSMVGKNPYDKIPLSEYRKALSGSRPIAKAASSLSPDQEGELLKLSNELNVSTEIIRDKPENFELYLKERKLYDFMANTPMGVLSRRLRDVQFATLAQDDNLPLSTIDYAFRSLSEIPDDISRGYNIGTSQRDQSNLGYRQTIIDADSDESKRNAEAIQTIEQKVRSLSKTRRGADAGIFEAASTVFGQQNIQGAVEYGVASGLVAGSAVGAATVATVIGAPTAPLTTATAAVGGFFAGFTAYMASDSLIQNAGESYLKQTKEGVPHDVAKYTATAVGLVNASLDMVGLKFVTDPAKAALTKLVTAEVAKSMQKKSVAGAVASFGKNYSQAILGESTTESLQELVNIVSTELSKKYTKDEYETLMESEEGWQEIASELGQTFEFTAKAMLLLGLAPSSATFAADVNLARKSQKQQKFFEDIGKASSESKMRGRAPSVFNSYLEEQAGEAGAETVFVGRDQLDQVMRDNNLSIEEIRSILPDVADQLESSDLLSDDIRISTASYADKIAPTDLGKQLLPHVRLDENSLSASELMQAQNERSRFAQELSGRAEQEIANSEEIDESAKQVLKTISSQLVDVGRFDAAQTKSYAMLVRNFYVTQAAELSAGGTRVLPMELYEQMPYRIATEGKAYFTQDQLAKFYNTETFKKFFGNSVLRNEQGSPLVVYHGTSDSVDKFDLEHPDRRDSGWLGDGVYLTDSPDLGVMYANEKARKKGGTGQNVMPLYARLENPYTATNEEKTAIKNGGKKAADAFTEKLKSQGYDGVILELAPDAREIVVFNPAGVKSTYNGGSWSMETSQILNQQGSVATNTPAFENFFGDSKVVDADGKPLIVYTGSIVKGLRVFDTSLVTKRSTNGDVAGAYFTSDERYASGFTRPAGATIKTPRGEVIPVYLRITNPLNTTAAIKKYQKQGMSFGDAKRKALEALTPENDGIIFDGNNLNPSEYVVFDPTQIKSVRNNGEFSTSDPDIYNQSGKKPQKAVKPVPTSIDEISNVESSFEFAATRSFKTNREFKLELQARVNNAALAAKIDLENFDIAVEQYLVRSTLADAITALRTNPNAVGWYNEKVTKALSLLSLVHPELATSAQAKFAFTWALAATSNGLKVNDNFKIAEAAYSYYKENGVMPTNIQAGTAQGAINIAMQIYNDLIARDGFEVVEQFMTTMHTAAEVEAYTGTKVSGEGKTTMVYGAAAIGPKIGNGFFANLYGHFEQLTMDRWLMRTWGRWTGTLVAENKANIKNKRDQLKSLIKALSKEDKKKFEAILKIKMTLSNIDAVGVAIKKRSMLPANRVRMNSIGRSPDAVQSLETMFGVPKSNEKRVGFGDQIRKVGNSLAGYLDGQKEAPSGAPERGRIRKVFQQALVLLQQDHPALTMADLQALLWYPEKRLYDAAKTDDQDADAGYDDEAAPDYANAAAALAKSKGVSIDLINQTIKDVDDGIRTNDDGTGTPQRGAGELFQQARDGGGRYSAGSLAPLEGAPTVSGATGPDLRLVAVAERYARDNRIDLRRQSGYARVNVELATRIAEAYAEMPNDPQNPVVAEAYQNLINQTVAQYQALVDAGYEFYFIDENNGADYLSTPFNAVRELRQDQRMGVYPTEAGFGSDVSAGDTASNPMLADTGLVWLDVDGNPKRVLANDLFRAVHDAFGHSLEGAGFRARGEENAWQAHVRLYTGSAVGALTSETRGQNSWLHFGPFGESNTGASVADTVFAEQKTGLMPEWTSTEGRVGDQETIAPLEQQGEQASTNAMPKRGGFDPSTLTTIFYEKADLSTFLHETGHFFLTAYADLASNINSSQQQRDDMQSLLDWFGVKDLATWKGMSLEQQRKYHEQFAYSFEKYLFENEAPNVAMRSMFRKFSDFLVATYKDIISELNSIYKANFGTDLPMMTQEVKDVMGRMVTTQEAIDQAQLTRGMVPLFQDKDEASMSDEQWGAYLIANRDTTSAALENMNKQSLRQLKWLENAKSKYLKQFQKEAREERARIQEGVTRDLSTQPIYQVISYLKTGKWVDTETGEARSVEGLNKLDKQEILEMYMGEGDQYALLDWSGLGFGKYGMVSDEGVSPQLVAELFGFASADQMIREILNTKPLKDAIREQTDQTMLEQNSELTDPEIMAERVNEAVHTEARARFIAVELRFLQKTQQPVRVLVAAAKMAAEAKLDLLKLSEISPNKFTRAEARYARLAMEALRSGKSQEAARHKYMQLMNNQLAKIAIGISSDRQSLLKTATALRKRDERLAKTRDMNYLYVARSILAKFGLYPKADAATESMARMAEYDPTAFAELAPLLLNTPDAKDFKNLTYGEFVHVKTQIDSLWHMSRRAKVMMINGKMVDKAQAVEALSVEAESVRGSRRRLGAVKGLGKKDKFQINLMRFKSALKRVEHWVSFMDAGKIDGPFRQYLYQPIADAIASYRLEKVQYLDKYLQILKPLAGTLSAKKSKIYSKDLDFTFDSKGQILHAMLHTGNSSNKRKLLLGREWAVLREDGTVDDSRWNAFLKEAQENGTITKADWDAVQKIWDLLAELKPQAQKVHKDMYGFYFAEITSEPVETAFGTYAGGYVPAVTDPYFVTRAQELDEQETSQLQNSFMFPTTGRGFTKSRVNYEAGLQLDLGSLASHIDKVLRFIYIEPKIKDAASLVKDKNLGLLLDDIDASLRTNMLIPWLQRAAKQVMQAPMSSSFAVLEEPLRKLRTRAGYNIMVGNIVNVLQQATGFALALLKVDAKYLHPAFWTYLKSPAITAESIMQKSVYMQTRMSNSQYEVALTIEELLTDPSKYEDLQSFAQKHGYFMQQGVQNMVDTIVWIGAYNQEYERSGEIDGSDKLAIDAADSAVRETQGSFSPEDASAYEVGTPFFRLFNQFYSYFNMQANLLGSSYGKIQRQDLSFGAKSGKLFYLYVMGLMIPAVVAEMIAQTFRGFEDYDDDDDWDAYDFTMMFFDSQFKTVAAMVPFAGQGIAVVRNQFNDKTYDDRLGSSPTISSLESATRGLATAGKGVAYAVGGTDKDPLAKPNQIKRFAKDIMTTISLLTGIPLGQVGKTGGYLYDVSTGEAQPESAYEAVAGVISGRDVSK